LRLRHALVLAEDRPLEGLDHLVGLLQVVVPDASREAASNVLRIAIATVRSRIITTRRISWDGVGSRSRALP
jgi:hypothetical protein